jgi:threonyl-tRNA synthetase
MRDHRKLGRELELFHSDPLVGAGLPIWLPAGAAARQAVESYVREQERRAGYQHVYSPPLAKRQMYEKSGHLAKFADDMFPGIPDGDEELMLRPSLCPHHAMVFASRGRSYRDLPLRIAELGPMYRAERSGVLSGLSRVRAISLNDSHNFCALDQVGDEVGAVLELMSRVHGALGFVPSKFRLSLRGADFGGADQAGNFIGEPADWDLAERLLREALHRNGLAFEEAPGEAAFYGPKIDVQIVDPSGREWSLATVQVDFLQPDRFDLSYVDKDAERRRPVMVHRSLVGSLERLFAHLIEVHNGAFPAWYAPVQVMVLPVGPGQADAAYAFARAAVHRGLRADVAGDGSLGARIRAARRVPYVAVIGAREAEAGAVALRVRDGADVPGLASVEALALLEKECGWPM